VVVVQLHAFITMAIDEVNDNCHVLFVPWAKSLQYPMQRELGRPQSRFGHPGENKIFFHYWESNHNSMVVQLSWYSDYTKSLYQLSHPGSNRSK